MTIEDVYKLIQENKIRFYNVSYREYFAVLNDYIIQVYPFVTQVRINPNDDLKYEDMRLMSFKTEFRYHHVDFEKCEVEIDPCIIFEMVCGIKIHTKRESDAHLMNLDHSEEIKSFNSEIVSQKRNNKLNQLGI